jgi:hypothetical protein
MSNIPAETKDKVAKNKTPSSNTGIGSKFKPYPKLRRNATEVETVINGNSSNGYISIGKDRPASPFSGQSGAGSDNCDAIDIVAGPLGEQITTLDRFGKKITSFNPHFGKDASRVYITQNGNIDDYFGLKDGLEIIDLNNAKTPKQVLSSRGKSAVALKADHIRIISRELVKIISSGTDDTAEKGGVCLIAENNQEILEPMVLGNKLVNYIDEQLITTLSQVIQIMYDFMNEQVVFNSKVVEHEHISPFFGKPIPESPSLKITTGINQLNQMKTIFNNVKLSSNNEIANKLVLLPISKNYILSKYHKLN